MCVCVWVATATPGSVADDRDGKTQNFEINQGFIEQRRDLLGKTQGITLIFNSRRNGEGHWLTQGHKREKMIAVMNK